MGYLDELRAMSENDAEGALTKPTKSGSVSLVSVSSGAFQRDTNRVLKSWCTALEKLDSCEPNKGFAMGRWQKLYDCSVWLVETFGRQLALDGWTTGDVFGVHSSECELPAEYEGCGGLVDSLGHHRALVLADGEARWRYLGKLPQSYRRGSWPNLQPFWSVEL